MPLSEVTLEQWGGLDLANDPGEVGATAAIDLWNVDFDQLGRVKTRQGYELLTRSPGVNPYDGLHVFHLAGQADTVLGGAGRRVEAIKGGTVTQSVTTNASPHFFTAYGTATENRVYIANGVDTVRYYTDDAFTTPSYTGTTPTGKFVAVQQPDNRLVVARTAANRSRVLFSDAGDPHTFQADNYVDLSPGDGEEIRAVVSWREYVFVFKESKFYFFYGNDTDQTGSPVFNNRGVYGAGVRDAGCAVAARDGVYFLDRRGLYKTTGGNPDLVSRRVDPLFAPISGGSQHGRDGSSTAIPALCWADDRLHLSYPAQGSTTNNRVLVYHCTDQWYSLWGLPASSLAFARVSATDPLRETLVFGNATSNDTASGASKHIGRLSSIGTDNTAAISSFYQTGFMDFGDSSRKRITQTLVDGNGTINVSHAVNFGDVDGGTRLVLPTGSEPGRKPARRGYRGHNFSLRFASVAGSTWRVARAVEAVRSTNPLGVE